ncbi:MAG: hypothetical protein GX195_08035, partial [Firmicutes bacterium]|nr:hypothetical protein [Bacillota bacterium]
GRCRAGPDKQAIQPGEYTVTVTFFNPVSEDWDIASQTTSVGIGATAGVTFEFDLEGEGPPV